MCHHAFLMPNFDIHYWINQLNCRFSFNASKNAHTAGFCMFLTRQDCSNDTHVSYMQWLGLVATHKQGLQKVLMSRVATMYLLLTGTPMPSNYRSVSTFG